MSNKDIFLEYRNLLFSIAYNMLGIVEDAEDMVQDTFMKWDTETRDEIKNPKAYLVKIITNLSINYLKSAKKTRENYIGLWLPEPLMKEKIIETSKSIDLYHSLSIGMMVLLEKLSPSERAVFLLKEVFSYEYAEIAEFLEKEEVNCRQIFARAKKHLGGKEKRFEVDVQVHSKMLQQFLSAVNKGNLNGLIELLRDDIELVADGGGKSFSFGGQKFSASRKPILGSRNVSKFVLSVADKINTLVPDVSSKIIYANGLPSVVTYSGEKPICIICLEIADDKISNIYLHTNPDKIKAVS
jgi:RNA polymerase sigma-70 factor (ECF subfamily)